MLIVTTSGIASRTAFVTALLFCVIAFANNQIPAKITPAATIGGQARWREFRNFSNYKIICTAARPLISNGTQKL